MPRWTEGDIATFWHMRDNGASLKEIADALGRTLSSVEQKSMVMNRNKEDRKMDEAKNVIETTAESPAIEAQKPETASLISTATISHVISMICSQGLGYGGLDMTLTQSDATVVLRFKR